MKIIIDTNFFMAIAQFKIDIFSEIERISDFKYELCILDKTIDELNHIIDVQKGKAKLDAKLALSIIRSKNLKQIKTGKGKTDDLIVDSSDNNTLVATQDLELRKRLEAKKASFIGIRQKKYLYIQAHRKL